MPKPRSPVLGFNHNIRHKGWLFHVQTEDSGIQNPHIFTHLFHDGVILQTKKVEYDAESDVDIVKSLMQAQHKAVMKELKSGTYDVKIERYLGEAPPGGEPSAPGLPKVPKPGDYATEPGSMPYDAFELSDTATPPPGAADMSATPSPSHPDFTRTVEQPDPDFAKTIERQKIAGEEDDVDVSGVFRMISMPPADTARDEAPPQMDRPPRPGPSIGVMPETVPPPMPGYTPGQQRKTGSSPTVPPLRQSGQVPVIPPARPATVPPLRSPTPSPNRPSTPVQGVPSAAAPAPRPGPSGIVRPQPPPIPVGAGGPKPPGKPPPPPPPSGGVVVTRPAVVVGAPPKIIGAERAPTAAIPAVPRRPAGHGREFTPPPPTDNIFGQDLISEKSLDEVIMAYLSEDTEDE